LLGEVALLPTLIEIDNQYLIIETTTIAAFTRENRLVPRPPAIVVDIDFHQCTMRSSHRNRSRGATEGASEMASSSRSSRRPKNPSAQAPAKLLTDVRVVTPLGFAALASAALSMVAMLSQAVAARTGIWLVTVSLGGYGISLAIGRWIDLQSEEARRSA